MKLLILIFLCLNTNAFEKNAKVIIRDKKFRAKKRVVKLRDLISKNGFEGKYFKIVNGKDDKAVPFDHKNEELRLKAATTYYHLTKARNYFIEKLNSDHVRKMGQMVIRLDITNKFNELGHYANDNLDPQFNNALSIHESRGREFPGITPWGQEIWFRPKKVIKLKDLKNKPDAGSFKSLFKSFRRQTHIPSLNKFLSEYFIRGAYDGLASSDRVNTFIRTAGASIVLELLIWNGNIIEWLFTRKKFWLDSALVPEIIYHEYVHQALSDSIGIEISTPINEGLADFFAAKISGHPKLAHKIKKYNTFNGKDAENTKLFRLEYETSGFANSDFILGLLYGLTPILKEDTEHVIYHLRNTISADSNLRVDLLKTITDSCMKQCKNPKTDRLKILRYFYNKGL